MSWAVEYIEMSMLFHLHTYIEAAVSSWILICFYWQERVEQKAFSVMIWNSTRECYYERRTDELRMM